MLKMLKKIIQTITFVELPDPFEQELVNDLCKDLEHKKTQHPYLNRKLQMPQTLKQKHKQQTMNFQN